MRLLLLLLLLASGPALADQQIRVATYDVGFTRGGAGVLLRDLQKAPDEKIAGIVAVIQTVRPDILLLTGFDHDAKGRALDAFRALLANGPDGIDYPHAHSGPVNAGEPSGLDLDGDGFAMGWADNLGWGKFPGNGGMALLSVHPLDVDAVRTFNSLRWADLPGADLPRHEDGGLWPSEKAAMTRPLASRGFWDVPVELPKGTRLHILAANPTPPLFDGPEHSNVKRNRDEIRFWSHYLTGPAILDDQGRQQGPPDEPLIFAGNLNKDPFDGAGDSAGIGALLELDRFQDVRPTSQGARVAAEKQGGFNARHAGPAEQDTADWRDDKGPGNLRVDYVLPDARLQVRGAGVFWPAPGEPLAWETANASRHRLVWVDILVPLTAD
ncbi:MAG: endonuclease/exonuclease/phosphatase family protein [Pseudomonadota bacterium]